MSQGEPALLRRAVTSDGALDERLAKIQRIRDAAVAALAAVEAEHG